ncbi:MAG: hypothetical protein D6753_09245 [Planctomycetota bacterium]|nr:MAG: hypothetical protein D6753_09245 [Planctomycetota bacterium]
MESPADKIVLNLSTMDRAGFHAQLRSVPTGEQVVVCGTSEKTHGLAAGLDCDCALEIRGDAGDFLFMMGRAAAIELHGIAGDCAGYSLCSGSLLIRKSCGDFLGAYARGGFVGVHGRCGDYCGYALDGGDVVVRSVCGQRAACGMTSGDLVLCNGAGDDLGLNMQGGTIFVRGDVASFAPQVRMFRMKDTDSMRLSLLLARAGIKGDAKQFKVYRPKVRSK